MPMNRLMVKPMPPKMAVPKSCIWEAPRGISPKPVARAILTRAVYSEWLAEEKTQRDANGDLRQHVIGRHAGER